MPQLFNNTYRFERELTGDKLLLIPLRHICKTTTDVAELIGKIFRDIREKKALQNFEVAQELKKGERGALTDALILRPSVYGVGFDVKAITRFLGRRKQS